MVAGRKSSSCKVQKQQPRNPSKSIMSTITCLDLSSMVKDKAQKEEVGGTQIVPRFVLLCQDRTWPKQGEADSTVSDLTSVKSIMSDGVEVGRSDDEDDVEEEAIARDREMKRKLEARMDEINKDPTLDAVDKSELILPLVKELRTVKWRVRQWDKKRGPVHDDSSVAPSLAGTTDTGDSSSQSTATTPTSERSRQTSRRKDQRSSTTSNGGRNGTAPMNQTGQVAHDVHSVTLAMGQMNAETNGSSMQVTNEMKTLKETSDPIRQKVYHGFKFVISEKEKAFGQKFCEKVFSALGEPQNEKRWLTYRRYALYHMGKRRTGDQTRIKETFLGKKMKRQ
jgi:hypothetical protein